MHPLMLYAITFNMQMRLLCMRYRLFCEHIVHLTDPIWMRYHENSLVLTHWELATTVKLTNSSPWELATTVNEYACSHLACNNNYNIICIHACTLSHVTTTTIMDKQIIFQVSTQNIYICIYLSSIEIMFIYKQQKQ